MALVIHDKEMFNDIKNGIVSVEEVTAFLMRSYPVTTLAHELAEVLMNDGRMGVKPVVLTQAQFKSMFRVQGFRWVDGELKPENRGAKRKDV